MVEKRVAIATITFWVTLLISVNALAFNPLSFIPDGVGRASSYARFAPPLRSIANRDHAALVKGYLEAGGMRLFELSELDQFHLAAGYQFGRVGTEALVVQFGTEGLYFEQSAGIALSYHAGPFRVRFHGYLQLVEKPGIRRVATRDVALSKGVSAGVYASQWRAEFTADNFLESIENYAGDLPRTLTANAAYAPSKQVVLLTSVHHEENRMLRFGFGQELRVHPSVALLLGVTVEPFTYGGGILTEWSRYRLRYATELHPVLGFSHAVVLGVQFGKKS